MNGKSIALILTCIIFICWTSIFITSMILLYYSKNQKVIC